MTMPEDAPAAPKKNNTMLIVAVVIGVLCCCCVSTVYLGWQFGDQILELLGIQL